MASGRAEDVLRRVVQVESRFAEGERPLDGARRDPCDLVDPADGAELVAESEDRLEPPRAPAVRRRRAVQVADDPALAAVEEVAAGEEREDQSRGEERLRPEQSGGRPPGVDEETDGEQRGQQRRRADEKQPRAAASLRLAAIEGHDADGKEERREGADEVQKPTISMDPSPSPEWQPGAHPVVDVYRHTSTRA